MLYLTRTVSARKVKFSERSGGSVQGALKHTLDAAHAQLISSANQLLLADEDMIRLDYLYPTRPFALSRLSLHNRQNSNQYGSCF